MIARIGDWPSNIILTLRLRPVPPCLASTTRGSHAHRRRATAALGTDPAGPTARPFGLDADDIIGGQPAAIETRPGEDGTTITWWQLSQPGFPDQWIELHAEIAGLEPDTSAMLEQINAVIDTVSFP